MAEFHKTYDLAPGEVLKFVPQPYIADRLLYYKNYIMAGGGGTASTRGPDVIIFEFDGATPTRFDLKWRMTSYGSNGSVGTALDAPNIGSAERDIAGPI